MVIRDQAQERSVLSTAELRGWVARLSVLDTGVGDAERVDQLRLLEGLKAAAAAAQARVTVDFARSQVAADPAQEGRGVAAQVALARRDSPHRGARHVGLAQALVSEMPHTLAALSRGQISEWRATLMVRETAVLSVEDRRRVDTRLAGRLEHLGDRGVEREARALAYQLDPGSILRRGRRAVADRRVSLRPAPDTMTLLTGFLPVAHGVAAYAALSRDADLLRQDGDPRSRGQLMADLMIARLTGQEPATGVPVEVQVVMSDRALLGDDPTHDHTAAYLVGGGPIPASLARDLVADAAQAWIRRLYTSPTDGTLVAMDSRRRSFDGKLRQFLVTRDQICRTPWCDAPIRHADHITAAADHGTTSGANGQGLCEACNYTKALPGWTARTVRAGPRHEVITTTPTRHTVHSRAPALPGWKPTRSRLEAVFTNLLLSA
jgi:hypothetical protein